MHNQFALKRLNKVNSFKEYFDLTIGEIKETVESLGFAAEWTISGRAKEYEESLKISKQLKDGTLSEEEYLRKWQKYIKSQDNDETSLDFNDDLADNFEEESDE